MGKGQTFLSESEKTPNGEEKRHLRIIITNPNENNEYLVVSVTTWHEGVRGQDPSCILPAKCHSFIKHKSWVDFSRTRAMTYIEIFNGLRRGLLVNKEELDPVLIQSIQGAASISEFIPEELITFFEFF